MYIYIYIEREREHCDSLAYSHEYSGHDKSSHNTVLTAFPNIVLNRSPIKFVFNSLCDLVFDYSNICISNGKL